MATVAASLAPEAGYTNVTLTSWAGDAAFVATPVAGGQIEHVDTIAVDATGVVTGSDGTYTLLYISLTGASQAIEYLIGEPAVPAESATVSAVLSSGAGWDYVTLTSWAGDASFATTPVAGGQIEHVDTISVDATGVVTGSDGTYTLLYISPTGAAQAVSYTIANPDVVDPIIDTLTATGTDPDSIAVSFNSNEDNGTSYFFATAAATTETASAIKAGAQGSQAVTATGAQSLTLTLATGTWYIHALHEDAAGNPSNILVSDAVTLAEIVESATTTAVFSGGVDYTTATLAAGFDASVGAFENWTGGEPAAGWQIETLTAEGWFDEDGQYWKPAGVADGIQDVWVIQPDGVVTVEQFDNTGLATVPDEGVVIDSVSVPNAGTYTPGETLTFTVNCNEAAIVTGTPGLNLNIGGSARQANYASGTGTVYLVFDYTVQVGDNDANGIAVTSLSLNDGTIKDEAGNDASLTLNSVGDTSGVLVDGTVTPTTSTLSMTLDNIPDGTYETIILNSANNQVLFWGDLVWSGESSNQTLDIVSGLNVIYIVVGETKGGLQRGVTA